MVSQFLFLPLKFSHLTLSTSLMLEKSWCRSHWVLKTQCIPSKSPEKVNNFSLNILHWFATFRHISLDPFPCPCLLFVPLVLLLVVSTTNSCDERFSFHFPHVKWATHVLITSCHVRSHPLKNAQSMVSFVSCLAMIFTC